jgi:hypothetical protein
MDHLLDWHVLGLKSRAAVAISTPMEEKWGHCLACQQPNLPTHQPYRICITLSRKKQSRRRKHGNNAAHMLNAVLQHSLGAMSCSHPDIQEFDQLRCCLSCGEVIFEVVDIEEDLHNSSSSYYQYKRLNYELGQEIRLVVLYPGRELDDITCKIIHVNLINKPAFEAVSYTWATISGDASLSAHVSCGGKKIAITANCEAMLRCLRRQGRNRTIWVDAISIDQKNTLERNHQVKLMAIIYSNASQVLAYLCPQRSSSEGAPKIDRIMEYLETNSDSLNDKKRFPSRGEVATFLGLPYFDRVWVSASCNKTNTSHSNLSLVAQVLQEIALAKLVTAIAGDKSIHWTASTVTTLLALCSSRKIETPSVLRWLPASRPEEETLLDVLHRGRNCSATNPRDKVYALLGLVRQQTSDSIPVDYSGSKEAVFTMIATDLLQKQGRFDVLSHAVNQTLETDLAPSWVPQWDVKCVYAPLPRQFTPEEVDTLAMSWYFGQTNGIISASIYVERSAEQHAIYHPKGFRFDVTHRAVTATEPLEIQRQAPPCLRIRAHHLDTITKLLPAMVPSLELILPRAAPLSCGTLDPCPTCLQEGIHAPCSNCLGVNFTNPCQSCIQRRASSATQYQASIVAAERIAAQRNAFKEETVRSKIEKVPFVTKQSLGFAREWKVRGPLRVGDTIWALTGLDVPVILRREYGHYVLVGECYLFRATLPHLCAYCGREARPWSMVTEVIDIW